MDFYNLDIKAVLQQLKTDPSIGLTKDEAAMRQGIHQKNISHHQPINHIWSKIIEHLKEPLIIFLMISSMISFILESYIHGFGIFIAVIVSIGISAFQESRSEKLFASLSHQDVDSKVRVVRDGECFFVPKENITIGDILYLKAGEKVPADGRIIDHENLFVDESIISRDRTPMQKTATALTNKNIPPTEQINMVFAGTLITSGEGLIAVTAIGEDVYKFKNHELINKENYTSTKLENKLFSLAKKITILALFTAGFFLFLQFLSILQGSGYVSTRDFFIDTKNIFIFSIALIFTAVPEGIIAILKTTFAFSIKKMSKLNILVRPSLKFENLCNTNVICLDSLGAITTKEYEISNIWENGDFIESSNLTNEVILNNICLNNSDEVSDEKSDIQSAIFKLLEWNNYKADVFNSKYDDIRAEFNETQEEKKDTITFFKDKRYSIFTKGDYHQIIEICSKIKYKNEIIDFSEEMKSLISRKIQKLENEGKKVIAFAHQNESKARLWTHRADVEKDLTFDGFIAVKQNIKNNVLETINKLKRASIDLKIFTTSNFDQAFFLAQALGFPCNENIVLDSKAIDDYSDAELSQILPKVSVIANSNPLVKHRIIKLLKLLRHSVLSGNLDIKDTPSLEACDVNVAMESYSCDYVKEYSDIVIKDDDVVSSLTQAIRWARGTYNNLQRFIQFQLTLSIPLLLIVLLSQILNLTTPFTTIGLLWINIILSGVLALSFALETPSEKVLFENFHKKRLMFFSKSIGFRIFSNSLFITVGMLLLLIVSPREHIGSILTQNSTLSNYIPIGGDVQEGFTIIFTCFIMFNIWNAFNSRELKTTPLVVNLHKNPTMLLAVALIFVLQIAIVQFASPLFDTVPLSYELWLNIIIFTFSIVLFNEILKLVMLPFKK